ncbi:mechanosensitive ion channel family protein [Nonomuraea soli]|uniref:Small-conductance mechanosensitive channel n=1 Tax=Nonomuraea soli TaxID=1032476 RepID=A0A7W0HTC4_9ACTN|nr:mechanosensitive ion channel domain-containing protein [Nonomuraea soli]MBA2894983.1 small-conductance mechanosensitive channel [Nonomuraea soli]
MSLSQNLLNLAGGVLGAVIVVELIRRLLIRATTKWSAAEPFLRRCVWPGFAVAVLVAFNIGFLPNMFGTDAEGKEAAAQVDHVLGLLTIVAATWLVIQATYAVTDVVLNQLERIDGEKDRRARRIRTQITLVRRVAAAVIVVIALGAILFSFPQVRALGTGLLASAGIAGAIVGIAAQSTIGNMLAGLQLAFSDALRLDDVVVVNNEWGRIEELTLTYVVVRSWDERRLVFPVSYFTQNPFENWTRHGSRVIGHVYLRVDWSVPVPELREELHAFVKEHPLWDQKDWTLQITDILPNGLVELRALMSAADSASVWDLKCDAREHLVEFIRTRYPHTLPSFRIELGPRAQNAGGARDEGGGQDPA